jgi:hypothetical protein
MEQVPADVILTTIALPEQRRRHTPINDRLTIPSDRSEAPTTNLRRALGEGLLALASRLDIDACAITARRGTGDT